MSERTESICPACGAAGSDRNYRVDDYALFRCVDCATEFLVLIPGGEPYTQNYWDAYKFQAYGNADSQADYGDRYTSVFSEVRKYTSTTTEILDIGCGIGNFLDWANNNGHHAVGAEIDPPAIEEARRRGFEVHEIDTMTEEIEDASVDIFTMWDVIEHLVEPLPAVQAAVPLLRPGGLAVFETPDVKFPLRPISIALRKIAEPIRYSDVLYFAGHRTYFSAEGLGTLLEAAGLEVMTHVSMRSPGAKMKNLFTNMDSGASGRSMAYLYGPLDKAMAATNMNNKLIMIARKPW